MTDLLYSEEEEALRSAVRDLLADHCDAPGVIAYYLGVPPGETMGHPLVRQPPWTGKSGDVSGESWFVVEQRLVPSSWRQRLDRSCESSGVFPGAMIVRDRTVLVYHCSSKSSQSM